MSRPDLRSVPAAEIEVPTIAEIRSWPATVSLPQAGRCFGLGPWGAYSAHRAGNFPVRTLRLGKRIVVPTQALLEVLGIDGREVG